MKLSTKGRYGLRAILDIAVNGGEEAVAISSISERQKITVSYLEQLIAKLKRAGLVVSVRGAQGGYLLARPAAEISVGDVLRALEGELFFVGCTALTGEEAASCAGVDRCVTKIVWQRISDSIKDAVDRLMLSELAEKSWERNGKPDKE